MTGSLGLKLAAAAFSIYAAAGAAAFAQTPADKAGKADKAERVHKHVTVLRQGGPQGRDQAQYLRNILQLRANQDGALNAYLEATRPNFDRLKDLAHGMAESAEPGTTAERLAKMEQRLADQQAEGRAQIEATRRFYAQLDPAQKRAFDELPLRIGGHGLMGLAPMIQRLGLPMPPTPPAPPVPPTPLAPL